MVIFITFELVLQAKPLIKRLAWWGEYTPDSIKQTD